MTGIDIQKKVTKTNESKKISGVAVAICFSLFLVSGVFLYKFLWGHTKIIHEIQSIADKHYEPIGSRIQKLEKLKSERLEGKLNINRPMSLLCERLGYLYFHYGDFHKAQKFAIEAYERNQEDPTLQYERIKALLLLLRVYSYDQTNADFIELMISRILNEMKSVSINRDQMALLNAEYYILKGLNSDFKYNDFQGSKKDFDDAVSWFNRSLEVSLRGLEELNTDSKHSEEIKFEFFRLLSETHGNIGFTYAKVFYRDSVDIGQLHHALDEIILSHFENSRIYGVECAGLGLERAKYHENRLYYFTANLSHLDSAIIEFERSLEVCYQINYERLLGLLLNQRITLLRRAIQRDSLNNDSVPHKLFLIDKLEMRSLNRSSWRLKSHESLLYYLPQKPKVSWKTKDIEKAYYSSILRPELLFSIITLIMFTSWLVERKLTLLDKKFLNPLNTLLKAPTNLINFKSKPKNNEGLLFSRKVSHKVKKKST